MGTMATSLRSLRHSDRRGQIEGLSTAAGQRVLVPTLSTELVPTVVAQNQGGSGARLPTGTRPEPLYLVGRAAQLPLNAGGAVEGVTGEADQLRLRLGRLAVVADWSHRQGFWVSRGDGGAVETIRDLLLHLVPPHGAVSQVHTGDVMQGVAVEAAIKTKRRSPEAAAEVLRPGPVRFWNLLGAGRIQSSAPIERRTPRRVRWPISTPFTITRGRC